MPAPDTPDAPGASAPRTPALAFTGDAAPYTTGDPYADYRSADLPFARLTDLAAPGLGAGVIAAGDEFFASRENLIAAAPAVFDPGLFGPKGKIMDGWETRRRRGPDPEHPWPDDADHDWALVRLGAPGVVHGVVVDTAHFRGNHPAAVSVEATAADGTPGPEELAADTVRWTTLVPRTPVGGHAANGFAVDVPRRFTHLRLNQFPDGGIARLRVYGEVLPDPGWLAALGTFDVLAEANGGRVEDSSDHFFSPAAHTIGYGRSRAMHEGWETRRRRDHGHDWVAYALTAEAEVRAVEIDTACYRGNAAGWASVSLREGADGPWTQLLPRTRLQPDTNHRFVLPAPAVGTHARIDIFPDGGVSRLRLHGSLTTRGAAALAERHRTLGG
ncbi:allantoicase [Streptomyces sp. NPDC050560]|uniref:allantoicase n=1 Tax=Streptomyces sp. NPDC050560 TaxID=3365630 RepID=UPI0037B404C8